MTYDLHTLLRLAVAQDASDLHLTTHRPPALRRTGALETLPDLPPLSPDDLAALADALLSPAQHEALTRDRTVDLAVSLPEGPRFRVNLYRERHGLAAAIRRLDDAIRSFADLHLPDSLQDLADLPEGLVLVTGPTGSGKSTTLATLIDRINHTHAHHILTLEDPVEYLHDSRRSLVHQRELHTDFDDFAHALRAALREDPDVILLGEMRDLETMRAALMAAETGHLVFSTLHAASAHHAPERLIGAFPAGERDAVRHQLALVLRAVVAQRLLRATPPDRPPCRVPALEVLRVTNAVAHLIRTGKTAQVYSAMENASQHGTFTLEQSLADLVSRGWLPHDDALRVAREPGALTERLQRAPRPRAGVNPWR